MIRSDYYQRLTISRGPNSMRDYILAALIFLAFGGVAGWYITRIEQKLDETETHLKFLTQIVQSQQGRSFK